jgi:hypothetical protein
MTVAEINQVDDFTTANGLSVVRALPRPTAAQQAECVIWRGLNLADLTLNGILPRDASAADEYDFRRKQIMKRKQSDPSFTDTGYLKSPEWQAFKEARERRCGSRDCWACGQANGALPLENEGPCGTANQAWVRANAMHHLTYRHFGAELEIDCIFLCTKHHSLVHEVEANDGYRKSPTYYAASVKAAISAGGGGWKADQIPL